METGRMEEEMERKRKGEERSGRIWDGKGTHHVINSPTSNHVF
jgi:hypothetical protein